MQATSKGALHKHTVHGCQLSDSSSCRSQRHRRLNQEIPCPWAASIAFVSPTWPQKRLQHMWWQMPYAAASLFHHSKGKDSGYPASMGACTISGLEI